MADLSSNVLYYGREESLPERTALCAGPLSLVYEAGDLRYIRLGDREIIRRIYVAIRDRNWGTVPARLVNVEMDVGEDSFRITYEAENQEREIDFFWKGTLTGDQRGIVSFSMDGEARSTFWRNRIGFCVLLPMRECAGQPCRIERVDTPARESGFPLHVVPEQPVEPFAELEGIEYQVVPDVRAEIRFSGDIFEMEDQRNWTDASYKIFCTPLRLSFPVEVEEGTIISQSITLSLKGEAPAAQVTTSESPLLFSTEDAPARPLPRLGLGVASHGRPLDTRELTRLRALHLSHLRVDLELHRTGYEDALRRAWTEANALGIELEVALHLSNGAVEELQELVALLEQIRPKIRAWTIFHRDEKTVTEKWVRLARKSLAAHDPTIPVGGGTNADFYQLNQFRPPFEILDFVSFSINPQNHAFDDASLIETLEAQSAPVASALRYFPQKPLAIGAVTLKPRFNPVATGPEPEPEPDELPAQVDVRQMSLLGAGWTVGSLGHLCASGVDNLTYFETSGWRGVMETGDGSPLPDKFRSLPGAVFPLYHVLADVGEFAGGEILPSVSSDPLRLDGLVVRREDRTRIIVANLNPDPQQVIVANLEKRVQVRRLDETNVVEAMQDPEAFRSRNGTETATIDRTLRLDLLPYACARIDGSF